MKILLGRSNPNLGKMICQNLGQVPCSVHISNFADGEIRVQILENIRGKDLFIIQSLQPPADNILELLLLIDAARRSSARRITVVIPYFGYARQDRKEKPRVPITSKLLANLLESAGANRILTMDLHAPQIQAFFDIPVDHLSSDSVFESFIKVSTQPNEEIVIVSPDVGGVKRIQQVSDTLSATMAIIHKKRDEPNQAKALYLIGDVDGKTAILRDDIIDTGGTLAKGAQMIKDNGASRILAFCTHPLLSKNAASNMVNSGIEKFGITDSIPLPEKKKETMDQGDFLYIATISHLFAAAIRNIHLERSVSVLFGQDNYLNL